VHPNAPGREANRLANSSLGAIKEATMSLDYAKDRAKDHVNRQHKPVTSYPRRVKQPPIETLLNLGPLALLAGHWVGRGFNTIWRPDNLSDPALVGAPKPQRRFLQLNRTSETLAFDVISSPIPNRGVANQPDISIYGLNYLQKVKDNDTDIPDFPNAGEDLHIEPGLFLNVPASGGVVNSIDPPVLVPSTPASIVRLATIPHGVSVLMQGDASTAVLNPGAPVIPPVYPIAEIAKIYTDADSAGIAGYTPAQGTAFSAQYESFPAAQLGLGIQPSNVPAQALALGTVVHTVPENTLVNDTPYPNLELAQSNGPFPAEWQDFVNDPNVVLRRANHHKTILGFIPITLATPSPSAISQIQFLGIADPALEPTTTDAPAGQSNAFVHSATSTFWIEWVKADEHHHGPHQHYHSEVLKGLNPFPNESTYLQLQYTQTVILNFNEVLWPHVSVATLRPEF
jgi:hypothetical protein